MNPFKAQLEKDGNSIGKTTTIKKANKPLSEYTLEDWKAKLRVEIKDKKIKGETANYWAGSIKISVYNIPTDPQDTTSGVVQLIKETYPTKEAAKAYLDDMMNEYIINGNYLDETILEVGKKMIANEAKANKGRKARQFGTSEQNQSALDQMDLEETPAYMADLESRIIDTEEGTDAITEERDNKPWEILGKAFEDFKDLDVKTAKRKLRPTMNKINTDEAEQAFNDAIAQIEAYQAVNAA